MCGRFTLRAQINQVLSELGITSPPPPWTPRFNIAPTQRVMAVRAVSGSPTPEATLFRWGLIPSWAKDTKIGASLINARSETVAEKPSFRTAFKKRRCLVLADGFYEWKKNGKEKQPYFIHRADGQPLLFAGLWDRWTQGEEPIESCTIITTTPNELMEPLHDRMPVILTLEESRFWLDDEVESPAPLQQLLDPYPADEMEAYPVASMVGSVKNDSPECVLPLAQ